MKRLAKWLAIIAIVIGGGIWTFYPINFWRLFDANMQPLALTQREAWCTGYYGIDNSFKEHDNQVLECHETKTELDNETPSVSQTPGWFCDGIMGAGWPGTRSQCVDIVDGSQLWPLLEGGLAYEWNDAHPFPHETKTVIEQPSRAGSRDNITNRGG